MADPSPRAPRKARPAPEPEPEPEPELPEPEPGTLAACPELFAAAEAFLMENTNFESSQPVAAAVEALGGLRSLREVFLAPLRRRLLGMEAALKWLLFLSAAPGLAREKEEEVPEALAVLDASEALGQIATVYDLGFQAAVAAHFEDSEDDDSDDSDDDSDDDEDDSDDSDDSDDEDGAEDEDAGPAAKSGKGAPTGAGGAGRPRARKSAA